MNKNIRTNNIMWCTVYKLIYTTYALIRLVSKNNTKIDVYFYNDGTKEHYLTEGNDIYEIHDLSSLSTEEHFQLLTVWDYKTDIDFVISAHKRIEELKKDEFFNCVDTVIEY